MNVAQTVSRGEYIVDIDDYGGCHFNWPTDKGDVPPLSLSPHFMREIEEARRAVREEAEDAASRAPYGHEKPQRRADQAVSHFCTAVGSTIYCEQPACPYCDDEEGDG